MRRILFSLLAVTSVLAVVFHQGVWALDLGRLSVYSTVDQPLKVKIELKDVTDEELDGLSARISPSDAEAGGASASLGVLLGANYVVEPTGERSAVLTVTTEKPFTERSVNMIVELAWPAGRAVKEYSFLLDTASQATPALATPLAASGSASNSVAPTVAPAPSDVVNFGGVFIPNAGLLPMVQPFSPIAPSPQDTLAETALAQSMIASSPVVESVVVEPPIPTPAPLVDVAASLVLPGDISYTVVPGDTLSEIVSSYMVEGLNLDQMLVAVYRRNAYLFGRRNMNLLDVGVKLDIPNKADLEVVSVDDARAIVDAQYADFRSGFSVNGRISSGKVSKVSATMSASDKLLMKSGASAITKDGQTRAGVEENVAKEMAASSASQSLLEAVSLNESLKEISARSNQKQATMEYSKYLIYGLPALALLFLLAYFFFKFRSSRQADFGGGYAALGGGGGSGATLNKTDDVATFRAINREHSESRGSQERVSRVRSKRGGDMKAKLDQPKVETEQSLLLTQLMDKLSKGAPVVGSGKESSKDNPSRSAAFSPIFPTVHSEFEDREVPTNLVVSEAPAPSLTLVDNETAMGTKFDLALAYMDIGEKENAVQLLNEVALFAPKDISEKARLSLESLKQS